MAAKCRRQASHSPKPTILLCRSLRGHPRTPSSSHGEKFEKKGDLLKPGSLWVYPAKHPPYAWTEDEEAVIQVQFLGPAGIDYINPTDDPRKK